MKNSNEHYKNTKIIITESNCKCELMRLVGFNVVCWFKLNPIMILGFIWLKLKKKVNRSAPVKLIAIFPFNVKGN